MPKLAKRYPNSFNYIGRAQNTALSLIPRPIAYMVVTSEYFFSSNLSLITRESYLQDIPQRVKTFWSCLKSGTLAYLSNRDRNNYAHRERRSAQNTAKSALFSMAVIETRGSA